MGTKTNKSRQNSKPVQNSRPVRNDQKFDVKGLGTSGTEGPSPHKNSNITDSNLADEVHFQPIPKPNKEYSNFEFSVEKIAAYFAIFSIVGGIIWYASKLDSRVETATTDITTLKDKSEKTVEEMRSLNSRVGGIESTLNKKTKKN